MTTLALLECPACKAALRAEDLDEARGIAKCSFCRALLNLPARATSGTAPAPRAEVPLPPRIEVEELPGALEIRRRWFSPLHVGLIFFCIAWDGFLVFWYSMAFQPGTPWILAVFPIGHLAVGVGITYFTLAGLLNTTTLRVEQGRLSVAHSPLPWPGKREIDGDEIAQLYCKERVSRGRRGTSSMFELWMAKKDGKSAKLLGAGCDADQVLFLEQRLERELAIADRRMPGELSR